MNKKNAKDGTQKTIRLAAPAAPAAPAAVAYACDIWEKSIDVDFDGGNSIGVDFDNKTPIFTPENTPRAHRELTLPPLAEDPLL